MLLQARGRGRPPRQGAARRRCRRAAPDQRRPARRPPARAPAGVAGRRPALADRLHRARVHAATSSSARSPAFNRARPSELTGGSSELGDGRAGGGHEVGGSELEGGVVPARAAERARSSVEHPCGRRARSTPSRSTSGQTPPGSRPSSSRTRSGGSGRSRSRGTPSARASRPERRAGRCRAARRATTRPSASNASVFTCSSAGNGEGVDDLRHRGDRYVLVDAERDRRRPRRISSGSGPSASAQYERGMPSTFWPMNASTRLFETGATV